MAGLNRLALTQLSAVAQVRWLIFTNRLRGGRAKFELLSRVASIFVLLIAALGPAIGLAFAAYQALGANDFRLLAGILWIVFVAWQFLPTLVIALTESWDTTILRRFPLSPFTYCLIWTLSGSLDPGSLVAGIWLVAVFLGLTIASPGLAPWVAVIILSFAGVNLLLSRLVVSWLSHWLAKRRTREIIGVLFILVAIGNQLIAKLVERHLPLYQQSVSGQLGWLFHLLPPWLAADAVLYVRTAEPSVSLRALAFLCVYILIFGWLLAIRVRAEYFGEHISESTGRERQTGRKNTVRSGIEVFGTPNAVSVVFEKELHTLFRSPQFILSMLLVPPMVLLVFGKFGGSVALSRSADLGLAFGLANALLALTRVVYNNLGTERTGVQFYFVAPVRFRQVIIGKNLAHALVLLMQCALVLLAVILLFGVPSASGLALAFAALCFGAAVNLSVGNIFSFLFPKREDFSLNRQRGSAASGFAALGVQFTVMAIAVPLFLTARRHHAPWLGAGEFLCLFGIALGLYFVVLGRTDALAMKRREDLLTELCRAT